MLIYHVNALIFNVITRAFENKTFTVRANSDEEAEQKAFDELSLLGIPLESVCTLVCSVN